MGEHSYSPYSEKKYGLRSVRLTIVAVVCLLIGLWIASGFDMVPDTVAQMGTNIGQTGMYPVVQRDGELQSPFVAVVENVKDAVVNISARSEETRLPWWMQGPRHSTSSGSGFIFRDDGYILTNNHVVAHAQELTVRTASGYQYDAVLVGSDPKTDLAVLKIEPKEDITVINFGDSDALRVGDWAIAIGNPFPQQGLDRTVTVGVISAKGRSNLQFGNETPMYQNYIQTDASINPGNSGGPLLNLKGECIGINAAISSPTGSSVGIGFAIPINIARSIVPDLIADGEVSRGWLGVYLGGNVTESEARRQGMDAVRGVVIDSVLEGSPAERAGIMHGDIVIGVNSQNVETVRQFTALVSTIPIGEQVPVEIIRDGSRMVLQTMIGDREEALAARRPDDDFTYYVWMGMELINFTEEIASSLNMKHVPSVFVRRVRAGSSAYNASIVRGSLILQIGNTKTESLSDIEAAIGKLNSATRKVPLIVQEPDGTIARRAIRPQR